MDQSPRKGRSTTGRNGSAGAESIADRQTTIRGVQNPGSASGGALGASPRSGGSTAHRPSEEQIRLRAWQIYCNRKGGQGCAQDDWLRAEQELIAEMNASSSGGAVAPMPSGARPEAGARSVKAAPSGPSKPAGTRKKSR